VLIIDRGQIIAQGTPETLRQSWVGSPTFSVILKSPPADAAEALGRIPGVTAVRPEARRPVPRFVETAPEIAPETAAESAFSVECARGADPREAIFRAAVERGWVLLELHAAKASLEDVFVRLTTRDAAAGEERDAVEVVP